MERQATERVKKLMKVVRAPKIVFSVEKATLFTKAYREYEGDPNVIRMAKAQAYVLDHISILFWTEICWQVHRPASRWR